MSNEQPIHKNRGRKERKGKEKVVMMTTETTEGEGKSSDRVQGRVGAYGESELKDGVIPKKYLR